MENQHPAFEISRWMQRERRPPKRLWGDTTWRRNIGICGDCFSIGQHPIGLTNKTPLKCLIRFTLNDKNCGIDGQKTIFLVEQTIQAIHLTNGSLECENAPRTELPIIQPLEFISLFAGGSLLGRDLAPHAACHSSNQPISHLECRCPSHHQMRSV